MKPILYAKNATGPEGLDEKRVGTLTDTIKCEVEEELNGKFELVFTYPVSGIHAEDLDIDSVVMSKVNDLSDPQLFRVYEHTKPINGRITYKAEHISYQLSYIPVGPFNALDIQSALIGLKNNALEDCPFTFWTDKTTVATYEQSEPASIRSRLGGVKGSILDVYTGEYEWDNFVVKLHQNRGSNKGVTLRYGKNISDISVETTIANTVTGIMPFWKDEDEGILVTLPENTVYSEHADAFPFKRTVALDCSSEFDEQPTVEALREYANQYVRRAGFGVPDISYTVSFVNLWQTPEYAAIAPLERVSIGDTVTIIFELLGVSTTAKMIKYKYDALKERYISTELGSVKSNLSKTINNVVDEATADVISKSDLERAIDHATDKITGLNGGYKVDVFNADGQVIETLFMDTMDIGTATKVWRWNINGLGYSSNGYAGPYDKIGLTSDGQINASAMTTGNLNANVMRSGRIASQVNPDDNYWDLDTGQFRISIGSVKDSEENSLTDILANNQDAANAYTDEKVAGVNGIIDDKVAEAIGGIQEDINTVNQAVEASQNLINDLNSNVVALGQRIWTDEDGRVHLSAENSAIQMVMQNNQIAFQYNGTTVGYINNNGFNLPDGVLTNTLTLGSHWVWFEDTSSGHLRLLWNP